MNAAFIWDCVLERKMPKLRFILPGGENLEVFHDVGQKIITQNEANDSFYVIKTGDAKVLLEVDPSSGKPITPPRELVQLGPGKFFGERALLKSEPASATIAAGDKGCVCYCCDRQDFVRLLGPLQALIDKAQAVEDRAACLTALALSHAFLLLSLLSPLSSLLLSC